MVTSLDVIDGLPHFTGHEQRVEQATKSAVEQQVSKPFDGIRAAFACVLHMHQPLVPAGGKDLKSAQIICNLEWMMQHQSIGDNHNAPVMQRCYERMGDFVPKLVAAGWHPRIMLEYSGTLLYGLRQMGAHHVLEKLKVITTEEPYRHCVEWLGCPWGHAVAPSTPVQDYRRHVRAFQHHFASLFGFDALKRVRGFSPSEMALPNHPDVCYEFVRTLKECGYRWVLVQEHTVELPDGSPLQQKHVPHRLVARNSKGEELSITAIVKTQGSDTKLIGQMQPYYEARSAGLQHLAGRQVPPLVTQIADGENGGVMMNEFPPKYAAVMAESSAPESDVRPMNVSEYLAHLDGLGIAEEEYPRIQPIMQHRVWSAMRGEGTEALKEAIEVVKSKDAGFHMEGGSWTSQISWVRGYENLLGPMEKVSAEFARKIGDGERIRQERRYRNALFHLLCSQTSCFRFWGQGVFVDYGIEIVRRLEEILKHDFNEVEGWERETLM